MSDNLFTSILADPLV